MTRCVHRASDPIEMSLARCAAVCEFRRSRDGLHATAVLQAVGLGIGATVCMPPSAKPDGVLADFRAFMLARTSETRNTCPYCSVGCGVILYTLGDKSKNAKAEIVHVEGDPDHPVNRGTLCPKGAAPRLRPQPEPAEVPGVPRARIEQVGARDVGLGVRPDRAAQEGRPRQELVPKNAAGVTSSLADRRLPRRQRLLERDRLHHRQGAPASEASPSTTRPGSDTAPRSPVWRPRSASAR